MLHVCIYVGRSRDLTSRGQSAHVDWHHFVTAMSWSLNRDAQMVRACAKSRNNALPVFKKRLSTARHLCTRAQARNFSGLRRVWNRKPYANWDFWLLLLLLIWPGKAIFHSNIDIMAGLLRHYIASSSFCFNTLRKHQHPSEALASLCSVSVGWFLPESLCQLSYSSLVK